MKTTKILVQKSETGLSEDNKAKLKSLKIMDSGLFSKNEAKIDENKIE